MSLPGSCNLLLLLGELFEARCARRKLIALDIKLRRLPLSAAYSMANLDIFWLKDESLEDSANLPDPDIIVAESVEDLEAALQQFAAIANDLKK